MTRIALAFVAAAALPATASTQDPPVEAAAPKVVLLNPNTAPGESLLRLPHVNEDVVARILEKRPFLSMDKLHAEIGGRLGEGQRDDLYRRLFVPIDLNTASRAEILLIPGVGRRMAHEFEEYRPYRNLEQFRREIGKYVDEKEVARLEQYVFVPLDLNTATPEQLATIPGVGDRMVHEFLEYRPYTSMEQFRREIGKYVDEKEVARLERYVFIAK